MPAAELVRAGAARDDGVQCLPLLRAVLPGVPGDGAAADVHGRRPRLPREPLPQLRRVPLRVPVRAAARVRHQRAADAGSTSACGATRTTAGRGARRGVPADGVVTALALAAGADRLRCSIAAWLGGGRAGRAEPARRLLRGRAACGDGRAVRRRRPVRRWPRSRSACNRFWRDVQRAWPLEQADQATCGARASRRADPAPPARQRPRLHLGRGGALAVAALVPPRTFYGFLLCFASTSVAAIYHTRLRVAGAVRRTRASRSCSAPLGGVGLVIGPAGLWSRSGGGATRRSPRQAAAGWTSRSSLLLLLTSVTGLALLVLRDSALMAALLLVHLGVRARAVPDAAVRQVRARLLPAAALVKDAAEDEHEGSPKSA